MTNGWGEFRGSLRRYGRIDGGAWTPIGAPAAVVVGREGYGWGRGVHGSGAPPGQNGPVKREGDGRSPAGMFEIGAAYGYAPQKESFALPYTQATATLRCVDDPNSRHYNQIVSEEDTATDWESAEHMRRQDDLYEITIVVEHNTGAAEPGAGSCIFLHVWEDANHGMSGCTAMSMLALEELGRWLRPNEAVLVALPRAEYAALRKAWGLP